MSLARVRRLKRYKQATVHVFPKPLHIVDSASFLYQYEEIFSKQIYKFKSSISNPYIIDAGANIGLSVIYFKLLYPSARIVAFEPEEEIYAVLKSNVNSFQLNDVECIRKAVWNKDTVLSFHSEGSDAGRILIDGKKTTTEVEATRLKPYITGKVDLLKMDIEGSELVVLSDIKDSLGNIERIFIEYHSFENNPQELSAILKILEEAGYRYLIHSQTNHVHRPFEEIPSYLGMDLQVNIYGTRH